MSVHVRPASLGERGDFGLADRTPVDHALPARRVPTRSSKPLARGRPYPDRGAHPRAPDVLVRRLLCGPPDPGGGRRRHGARKAHADMRDVLPTSASQANAHPWSGLERALLVRGASSIVFSERGDVVSVRFAIDDKLVQLEIPRHGDGAGVDWPVVERVLVSKLDAVRSGRSTFAA